MTKAQEYASLFDVDIEEESKAVVSKTEAEQRLSEPVSERKKHRHEGMRTAPMCGWARDVFIKYRKELSLVSCIIYWYLTQNCNLETGLSKSMSREDLAETLDLPYMTMYDNLRKLIKFGLVDVEGQPKARNAKIVFHLPYVPMIKDGGHND